MTNPAVHLETPRPAPASACVLGEGALWDHRDETLLFVDIKNRASGIFTGPESTQACRFRSASGSWRSRAITGT